MDNRFEFGDVLEMDGHRWVLVGMDGTKAVILQAAGEPHTEGHRRIVSIPTLYEAVGTSHRPDDNLLRPVDGDWPERVAEMGRHLQETIDGTPMDARTKAAAKPRAEYDPTSTTARERVALKVAELAGTSLAMSESSLWRLRRVYSEGRMPALAAHLKLSNLTGVAPRLYFLDTYSDVGYVTVGYLGSHMDNTLTN